MTANTAAEPVLLTHLTTAAPLAVSFTLLDTDRSVQLVPATNVTVIPVEVALKNSYSDPSGFDRLVVTVTFAVAVRYVNRLLVVSLKTMAVSVVVYSGRMLDSSTDFAAPETGFQVMFRIPVVAGT